MITSHLDWVRVGKWFFGWCNPLGCWDIPGEKYVVQWQYILVGQLIEYYMYININLGIDLAWMVTAHAWIEKAGAVFDFLC